MFGFKTYSKTITAARTANPWARLALLILIAATVCVPQSVLAQSRVAEPGIDAIPLGGPKNHGAPLDGTEETITLGNDSVTFYGVAYDFESASHSTWYYSITSGNQPNVSHSIFTEFCAGDNGDAIIEAGTWEGPNGHADLTEGGGNPSFGSDGSTGLTGLKFDEQIQPGKTAYYYFTLDGNYLIGDISVTTKAGPNHDTGTINGPDPLCDTQLQPGISIDKTDGSVSVNEGASFAYTLSYENTGQLPLSNVVITETVPSNTTFNAAGSTTGWSCAGVNPGSTCTFNVGNLNVGATGSVQFGLTVDEFWEPNPNTGLCPDQPPPVQVNNSADIEGQSGNGNPTDTGTDSTPVNMACEDNPATLTVVKVTDPPASSQSFAFTGSANIDGFGSFNLTGQAGSNSRSFDLPGGGYAVSETEPGGWVLESTSCTGGNTVGNINLDPGESVTCTFTNRKLQGKLTVVKVTDPANDPRLFTFTGPEGQFQLSHGDSEVFTLTPGNYSVSETEPSGWTLASATCDNNDDPASITIADGDNVTCTFTNEKDGEITIVKNATPDDTGQAFDFTGDLGAFSLKHGESKTVQKAPGTYSVAETVPSGWDLTSATCSDGSDASAIELAPGESVTCTFFNQRLQANLDVVKKTNGVEIREGICDNGITVGESVNWTYAVSNPGQQPLEIVSVIDDAGTPANTADDFSPAFVGGDTNGDTLLDPGEVWNYAQGGTAAAIQYTNQVTVTAEVQDNTKAPAGTIVEASDVSGYCGEEVDVAIEKTDGGQLLVPEGGTVIYTLSYENLGTVDVTGVVITEMVPQNTSFDAAGSTAGWSCADGAAAGTTCTFNVGPLAAGASGSVLFALEVDDLVQPDPDTGQCPADPPEFLVDNTGTIADDGANGADADPSNNSASDDTPIAVQCEPEQQTPSIVIQKTPDNQLVQEGQAAQFNIAVTNNGPVDLVNVVVSDQQAPDCNRNIGDLASGAIVVYNCSKPNVTQGFTNVATVTGETPDGGDVSDEDDAEVTVLSVDEPQAVVPIPTLSQWGLIFMAGLMLLFGACGIRTRKF